MMIQLLSTTAKSSDDGMIPLINIILLLLIFFMIVGRIAPAPDLVVQAPVSDLGERHTEVSPVIYVGPGGEVRFRGQIVDLEGDHDWNASLLGSGADHAAGVHSLRIHADRGAEARLVVGLLKDLRGAGVETVELVTER
ncbi:MAG: biopolymer transporter ExbD [Pseudomonadota bacterium]